MSFARCSATVGYSPGMGADRETSCRPRWSADRQVSTSSKSSCFPTEAAFTPTPAGTCCLCLRVDAIAVRHCRRSMRCSPPARRRGATRPARFALPLPIATRRAARTCLAIRWPASGARTCLRCFRRRFEVASTPPLTTPCGRSGQSSRCTPVSSRPATFWWSKQRRAVTAAPPRPLFDGTTRAAADVRRHGPPAMPPTESVE